ncbi:TrmH family RNA methyltransferase [Alicyclobacillus cycloheptanicus]|uniref:TrmH family RNA methyltransferase n=1 Tax=Alicyclobacillus cycloheptanicus TaxID=1457 RepID=A0ABT9XES3_9BACL|nr:RNA methyltransferase [Alicyclobacillus cycloheptanicus]MDQ0188796.1 TrmH family RNA methyltransferase [Alicyclobacillus cycloheptanicus]
MYLESPQNPKIHRWSQLKAKKGRQTHGAFLVEGSRLVEECLRSSFEVEAVLWDVGTDELPDPLTEAAMQRGVPVIEVAPRAFAEVSDTVTSQGVIAVAKLPNAALPPGQASFCVALDGVRDPGNVGTLLRSADAFGADAVYCGTGTVDPFSPKVVRASMGGIFRFPVHHGDSVALISSWRQAWPEGQVALADAHADMDCDALDFCRPTLILVGGEAFGASPEAAALATVKIRIPMTGMADSLNAAIAGSVLLYEANRQRRAQA